MTFWYPFRSREVAAITSRLTLDETRSLRAHINKDGMWCGCCVGNIAVFSVLFMDHFVHAFFASLLASCAVAAVVVPAVFVMGGGLKRREQMKQFLCSTVHAKNAGYKPESLRFNRWWF